MLPISNQIDVEKDEVASEKISSSNKDGSFFWLFGVQAHILTRLYLIM